MKPPKMPIEKVSTDDFIVGTLTELVYDMDHEFKSKFHTEPQNAPAIKFVFELDGYKEKKTSGWLKFNLHEKSNLYKKYVASLVENAVPYMDFDVAQLKGVRVKLLFKDADDGKYQHIDSIRPIGAKITNDPTFVDADEPAPF